MNCGGKAGDSVNRSLTFLALVDISSTTAPTLQLCRIVNELFLDLFLEGILVLKAAVFLCDLQMLFL